MKLIQIISNHILNHSKHYHSSSLIYYSQRKKNCNYHTPCINYEDDMLVYKDNLQLGVETGQARSGFPLNRPGLYGNKLA